MKTLQNRTAGRAMTAGCRTGTIIPGEEDFGWGHIGNSWDCFGCHESFNGSSADAASGFYTSLSTPQTGATIPAVMGLSVNSVTAGQDTELLIYGSGFINSLDLSDVILDNGVTAYSLQPDSQTEEQITVIVPATLPADLYDLRVVKDNKISNKRILTVVRPVIIANVDYMRKRGLLIITGSGFSEKVEGTDAYFNVEVNGRKADIIFWTDNSIKASISRYPDNAKITVNSLFGSATSGDGKPPKPCKGRFCSR